MTERVKLEDAIEGAIAAREQFKTYPHEREQQILEKFLNAIIEGLEEVRNPK